MLRFIVMYLGCVVGLFAQPATAQDHQTIRVDQQRADLLLVVDGWAIWRTSDLIESTRHNRGPRFVHRIYRQQISDPVAKLAKEFVAGAGTNPCQSIKPDGTLICLNKLGNQVEWIRPNGVVEKSQTLDHTCRIEKVYNDGVLILWTRYEIVEKFKRKQETWYTFAPFDDDQIDLSKQVKIRSDVGPLVYFRGDEPFRYDNRMVWWMEGRLYVVDLKTGVRKEVLDQDRNGREFNLRNAYVSGFDGELVLLGSNVVVDAKTGERVATNWDDKRINRIMLTHNRIGYRFVEGNLEAVDLENPDRKPVVLAEKVQQPAGRTKKGILVWNGKAWKTVPWYVPDSANKPDQIGKK